MSKTSIDGLRVRSSSPARVQPTVSSRRVVGDIVTPTRHRPTVTAKAKDDTRKSTQGSLPTDNNYDTFGKDKLELNSLDNSLGAVDEAAWSELLDGFGDDSSKKSPDLGLERREVAENNRARRRSLKVNEGIEEKPSRRERKQQKQKFPKKRRFKIKHPIFMTILIVLVALGVTGFVWGDSLISKLTNGQSGIFSAISALVSNEIPFETDANGRTNVLVFGTEGFNMDGATNYINRESSGAHDGANLTDSIMVISFDQKTQDVAMISIPRDLKVSMACSAGKINEVYWCHNKNGENEEAGALALAQQLEQVLGIEFQYWAHVNWGALMDIIDTIGGITVVLNEDIDDRGWTGTVIKAGVPTRLTGLQAVALARARHGTVGGDFTRGNSQQKIMEGIAQELAMNGVNITEAFSILNILGDNFRSNFSTDNIKAGVKLVSAFNPAAMRNILLVDYINNVYYMTTATINGISYVIPAAGADNYGQVHQYIAQVISSNPAVREGAEISVYNATGEAGVAGAEKTRLEADGYAISAVGDSEGVGCDAKYCVYAMTDEMPATQAALAERYGVEVCSGEELPEDIYAGTNNFVIVIKEVE